MAEPATVTRHELESRLEVFEKVNDAHMVRIETLIDTIRSETSEFKSELRAVRTEQRSDAHSLKTTFLVTAVSCFFGIGALNFSLVSNMLSAFESGKSTATTLTQATEQMKQTQEQLKSLQERFDRQATLAAHVSSTDIITGGTGTSSQDIPVGANVLSSPGLTLGGGSNSSSQSLNQRDAAIRSGALQPVIPSSRKIFPSSGNGGHKLS